MLRDLRLMASRRVCSISRISNCGDEIVRDSSVGPEERSGVRYGSIGRLGRERMHRCWRFGCAGMLHVVKLPALDRSRVVSLLDVIERPSLTIRPTVITLRLFHAIFT